MVNQSDLPWYRQVNREQWKAFFATFFGWLLDGFDFTIMTFILIDIQQSFTINNALAGLLGTVTLFFRLLGGFGAGVMADRYGRKLPLMLSILWFSLFAGLSGFSTSYAMLFACRALFGIGMGGEWAAGMPLAIEHWPAKFRGLVSGLLQGGFYWGYIASALAFHYLYPYFSSIPDPFSQEVGSSIGWRVMFWIGVVPALFVLWIRTGVAESPVWLARKRELGKDGSSTRAEQLSIMHLLQPGLRWVTVQTSLLMGAFMFSYYSITFWYPTFLQESGRSTLGYVIAFNLGAIVGMALWGRASETRLGRRGAVSLAALLGVMVIPAYVGAMSSAALAVGAVVMGACGAGVWGMVPSYLTERFPTAVRGVGPGLSYHVGAAIGAMTPLILGQLQDGGMSVVHAMQVCIAVSGVLVGVMIWMGPETRGRQFTPVDAI